MKKKLLPFLLFFHLTLSFGHEISPAVNWPKLSELDETLGLAEVAAIQDRDLKPFLEKSFGILDAIMKEAPPKDAKAPLEVRAQLRKLRIVNKGLRSEPSAEKIAQMRSGVWKAMQNAGVALYEEGPHHGWMIKLYSSDGIHTAWAEVKLHDDKGDLEVWYTQVREGRGPLSLELDTPSVVTFPLLDLKTDLFVRNLKQNEDEDGKPTTRNGKTNYFIFPTLEDQDPKPFLGESFASPAILTVGDSINPHLQSTSFLLVPHVHSDYGDQH